MALKLLFFTWLLFPIVYLISLRLYKTTISRATFLSIPIIHILIFAIDHRVEFMPQFPDSAGYRIALSATNFPADLGITYINFYYINTPIRFVGGGVPLFILVNSIMFLIGAALIWQSWMRVSQFDHHQNTIMFLVILLFWPGALLYIPSILREGQVIFFWGLSIYSIIILSKFPRWPGGWFSALFGVIGLLFLREELLPAALLFAAIYYAFALVKNIKRSIFLLGGALVIGGITLYVLGYSYLFNPGKLEYLRRVRTSPNNLSYMGSVDWENWFDVFLDSVQLTVHFFTSPLTNSSSPFEMMIASADGLFVIGVVILSVIYGVRLLVRRSFEEVGWLTGIFAISIGISLIEFHVTGAVRHRIPIVISLLPIAATELTTFTKRRLPQIVIRS